VHRCAGEYRTVGCSVRRYSARWAFESVCRQAQGEENSLSSVNLKKNPLRDLRRVAKYPEILNKEVS
jgi:hypothetical protein